MSGSAQFDASLPRPYSSNWREAYRKESEDAVRVISYQAPDGKPVPFIWDSNSFSGGVSKETVEYPFGGLWSNAWLNEKPQTLTVKGFLRGTEYIAQRTALIEALRSPTSDIAPGYLDLPFWGRFPVVVCDYEVSENKDEQGQCSVSLTLTRAGVSVEIRAADKILEGAVDAAIEDLKNVVAAEIESKTLDLLSFMAAIGEMKKDLLKVVGRIQGAANTINTISNEIISLERLAAELISMPGRLVDTLFNSIAAIVGGLAEIAGAILDYTDEEAKRSVSGYPGPEADNKKNALLQLLSAKDFDSGIIAVSPAQDTTKRAAENLYRITAFAGSAQILSTMDSITARAAAGYWTLLENLEDSIDKDSPTVYAAVVNLRVAAAEKLRSYDLSVELSRNIGASMPLLALAQYLGLDEARLRELNTIPDSFVVKGGVVYV